MSVEITLKNYRCFSDSKPATFTLSEGFTSFVGPNNSGKSTILKFFYEYRDIFKLLSDKTDTRALTTLFRGELAQFKQPDSIMHSDELFCNANLRDIEISFKFKNANTVKENKIPLLSQIDIIIPRSTQYKFEIRLYSKEGMVEFPYESMGPNEYVLYDGTVLRFIGVPIIELSNLLQLFKNLANVLYVGAFRNVMFGFDSKSNEKYFDISVGQSFVIDWRNFKMGTRNIDTENAYKVIEDIKHIFELSELDINPSASIDTLKLYIDGKSYFLSEVGSGITQFIIVLANAAMKKPSYILIDEPEVNLNPPLQLDFLTSLGSYASEGVLFTTHNYGLARASADRIYTVQQRSPGESEILDFEQTPNLTELIGSLSYSGYRALGFDKILLVEGTTEVRTIQQFLRLHKADHKIVLVPMGGKSLIKPSSDVELTEIKRISSNVYALIDSERSSANASLESRIEGFQELCEKLEIKCHVLDLRATENYFTEEAIQEVKGPKYKALEPYQKLNDLSPNWGKSENWKIARAMKLQDLEGTDLGDFLEDLSSD